jgi:hypothetical protein
MNRKTTTLWRRQLSGQRGDLSRRAGILFMVGSSCFTLGSLPLYFLNVPALAVGVTFLLGSIFFTSAGLTQFPQVRADDSPRIVWWATVIQLVGMIFFNINTFRAAFVDVPTDEVNQLIWAPDFFGSVAFLVASHLAWWAVTGRLWSVQKENDEWWMAALNYLGSIFFMLAAIGAFTLPTTGNVVNLTLVNAGTFFGAACFFVGGYLLLPAREQL